MEIIEVLSGRVLVRIGTESASAGAGDILFVPPGRMLDVTADEGGAALRGVIFDSLVLRSNMERFDSEVFYMFDVQSKNRIAVFGAEHTVHDALVRIMDNIDGEYQSKEVCYRLPVIANIYLAVTELLRFYCGSKDELDRMIYHNVLRLRPAVSYVEEHFSEKIYVERLADMINVSSDYFTKMFKDSIGKTPIDYINGLRVNRAMQLLATTDLSMPEIAEAIGFCNANYFHKIFKQYIDTSPLAYRKSCK